MLILRSPRKNLEITHAAEDWKQFLADPVKHWKDGRSAKMLAEAWESAAPGLPIELSSALAGTPFERFDPILAIPEYEVDLPGGRRPSQNDIFVLGRIDEDLAVIMVEGKVDESFGPELSHWLMDASPGKRERLASLRETLKLPEELPETVRYQLLHRTASPVLEASRLRARYAAMVVHSFSPSDAWLADYQRFASILKAEGEKGRLERIEGHDDPELWIGWVSGDSTGARETPGLTSQVRSSTASLPRIVAHADWGSNPKKRWMCVADLSDQGVYQVSDPELVGEPGTLIARLQARADTHSVLVGFDFPIGVPSAYAERTGISYFPDTLPELGTENWASFYDVAASPEQISPKRPFYPMRPGGTKQQHLMDALDVDSMSELLRACEHGNDSRGPASPLFWTLGGKQVGKAAIIGWKEVLGPALMDESLDVALWPFDGPLAELASSRAVTIAETYPAEACLHLGMTPPGRGWSKTSQEGRLEQRDALLGWAARREVEFAPELVELIETGFGPSKDAEDPFDAVLGALSMLEVVLGHRPDGAPRDLAVRQVEGWILGQV
jgi:hypothetical protein